MQWAKGIVGVLDWYFSNLWWHWTKKKGKKLLQSFPRTEITLVSYILTISEFLCPITTTITRDPKGKYKEKEREIARSREKKKSHIQTFRTPSKCFQFHSISCAPFDPANNTEWGKNIRHWAHKYYFIEFFNKANLHCLQWLVEWSF